jgi:hypothetical protein
MQEILERRHRFSVRQVLTAVDESTRAGEGVGTPKSTAAREHVAFLAARMESLRTFFSLLDAGIAAFTQGKPLSPDDLKKVVPLESARYLRMK